MSGSFQEANICIFTIEEDCSKSDSKTERMCGWMKYTARCYRNNDSNVFCFVFVAVQFDVVLKNIYLNTVTLGGMHFL